tara:strand:- start:2917 stop:3816 length:900 start_codon:yes stop_codon:yes gene_type:complete
MNNNNEIIELPENNQNSGQKQELFQCRICLEEEENIDLLIAPCRCSGTSKYVHIECLRRWRYQDINAPGFYRCMECNEEYIILDSDQRENTSIFYFFNHSKKVFYFQIMLSLPIYFFIYVIDVYLSNYKLITLFPGWYDNSLLNIIKNQELYRDILYFNFSIFIQNYIFLLIYILRSLLFIKNKKTLFYLMFHNISVAFVYYNFTWMLIFGMGAYNLYKFAIITLFVYQIFSYKVNYELIKKHDESIDIINSNLGTNVASMTNNPINILVDEDEEISDEEEIAIDDEEETSSDASYLLG